MRSLDALIKLNALIAQHPCSMRQSQFKIRAQVLTDRHASELDEMLFEIAHDFLPADLRLKD